MRRNHLFSQRSKTTERAVGVGAGDNKEQGRVWTKFEKEGIGNIGGLHKIGG